MPLPRPGARVARIPEAAPRGTETLPELTRPDAAPSLGVPPVAEEAPSLNPTFAGRAAQPSNEAPPWDLEGSGSAPADEPAVAEIVEPPQPYQAPTFPAHVPTTVQSPVAAPPQSAVSQQIAQTANVNAVLASMGFEGLELGSGFGAFPTVTLKDDQFLTSDGDKLGNTFACIIHNSKPKWIVKSSGSNDAEFVYTKDKVNSTSGRPLEATFKIWRAQGILQGDPLWKPYLDVMAQLIDVNRKETGQVVILQIPETSIERFKGYLTLLAIDSKAPSEIITQVYPGQKVTSTKFPFWPWAFKKWSTVAAFGL